MSRRGRPEFRPTLEQRTKVQDCIAGGMTHDGIANVIGIARDTLEKHFSDELTHGLARKRAEVLELLWMSARKGNVAAQKKLLEITGTQAAAAEWEAAEGPARAPAVRRLGKKEEAQVAAATAGQGSEWGDDLMPATVKH